MQNIRVKISISIIGVICFQLITGCSNSSYIERLVRKSQCLPPPFPTTESLNPPQEYYTRVDIDKPIQEISDYYQDLLTPVDAASSEAWINGTWAIKEESSSEKRFDCTNSIDSLTVETGCIFLHMKSEQESTIEYMWNLGEVAPGCSSLLEQ